MSAAVVLPLILPIANVETTSIVTFHLLISDKKRADTEFDGKKHSPFLISIQLYCKCSLDLF
jgi:hypothetical protein